MIDRNRLEALLARVAERSDVREEHAILMRFMCRCLALVEQFLPEVGRNALYTARTFWLEGKGQAEDLLAAGVDCWKYLDAKGRGVEIQDQEDAAMRAVLCVLRAEPESDDFPADAVRWFASMFDRLGDYSSETAQLMEV